jgi:hypothetical protein
MLLLLLSCNKSDKMIYLTVVDGGYKNGNETLIYHKNKGKIVRATSDIKSSFDLLFQLDNNAKPQYFKLNKLKGVDYLLKSNAIFPNEKEEHTLILKKEMLIDESRYFVLETKDSQMATFKIILDSRFELVCIIFPAGSCYIYSYRKSPKENLTIISNNFLPY